VTLATETVPADLFSAQRHPGAALQLAGFGLFGLSLAKLFVYDLAFLSSITRALSFLAVGAVLIAGGFFYQRLAASETSASR
jgi:uncharacterized membrane protein